MDKNLQDAIKDINKKYGQNSIMVVSDSDKQKMRIEFIDTGSFSLNNVFSCGGLPRGRMIEVFGDQGMGKSTLGMFLVAQTQKAGGRAVWVDAEYSFNRDYAEQIGVKMNELIISQPEYGEEGLDIVRKMAETGKVDIIVLDSVAALIPKRELDGEIIDAEMAQVARMMSKAMRTLAGVVSQTKTAVVFINQVRDKVGVFFGSKTTTPGGKALKFYSSVRLEVKNVGRIKKETQIIGNRMRVVAVKNKVGLPWREAEFDLIYGHGIDIYGDAIDFGQNIGAIVKDGFKFLLSDNKTVIGKNREDAKNNLQSDLKLFEKVKKYVEEKNKENNLSIGKTKDVDVEDGETEDQK